MFRVLLPALLIASPALAQHEGHGAAPTVKKAERKICKKEANTSSRFGAKKLCLTAAEWKARDRDGGIEERRNDTRQRED